MTDGICRSNDGTAVNIEHFTCSPSGIVFPYSHWMVVEWEKGFNYYQQRKWLATTIHIPIIISFTYLCAIFGLRRLMRDREPFKLKIPLILWNLSLAIFSIIGSLRTVGYNLTYHSQHGFHASVCEEQPINSGPYALWVWLFIISKIPELGDTLFIVLRKQKLIFLHWFHHFSVLILVWIANSQIFSVGAYFMCMNYVVHSIMYTYYTLRSMGIRVPRTLAMCITTSQLVQMVIGTYVTFYAFREQLYGRSCETHPVTIYLSLLLYAVYLILFANFFLRSYLHNINWKTLSPIFLHHLGVKVHIVCEDSITLNNNHHLRESKKLN